MNIPGSVFTLIIIRHGQTNWNKEERYRGRFDIALDEIGLRQSGATGVALKNLNVSAIYTSPLKRAIQTASAIANATGRSVISSDGLIDIDYGEWQGLKPAEAAAKDSELYTRWMESPHTISFKLGESLRSVEDRVSKVVDVIIQKHPNEVVAMVSHKVVCKVMVCHLMGLDLSHFWQIEQDLCALDIFENRFNSFIATRLNDTCHLRNI